MEQGTTEQPENADRNSKERGLQTIRQSKGGISRAVKVQRHREGILNFEK